MPNSRMYETAASRVLALYRYVLTRPFFAAVLVIAAYSAALLPTFAAHDFDTSMFIVAGDQHVDARQTPAPIIVLQDSDGYDGQYFYRLALNPFLFEQTAYGVQMDYPSYRMARIVYPLLGWLISFGTAAYVPAALFAINLLGLGAVAALSVVLTNRAGLPAFVPLAIVMWPGFFAALLRDTAEITAAALLLAAILCYVSRRFALYAVFGALATLTRETTLPVFAGLLLWDAWFVRRERAHLLPLVCTVALLMPFVAWREVLSVAWRAAPLDAGVAMNVGLPVVGALSMLLDNLTGARHWNPTSRYDWSIRAAVVVTASVLIGFCILVGARLRLAISRHSMLAPLTVSWALIAALMSLLKATGPWIEPYGYFRAFTECYVIGCLVLGASGFVIRSRLAILAAGAALFCSVVYFRIA